MKSLCSPLLIPIAILFSTLIFIPQLIKAQRVGGEDIASAVAISSLPFNDTGNTCSFADDYDEICPFNATGSADVVYSYTPASDEFITIDLCASSYDTKVYVYENSASPGSPYACNDDACGDDGFKSQIPGISLTNGNTYYIVVDGYGGDCGNYTLDIFSISTFPDNDSCQNAEAITGPYPTNPPISGTSVNATIDCPGLLGWAGVWYEIELPYSCNTVDIELCGLTDNLATTGVVLAEDCSCDFESLIFYDSINFYDPLCVFVRYVSVCGPGTVYLPLYISPNQDFELTVDVQDCEAPAPAPNGECCDYSICLEDAGGNGWEGGNVLLYVNGVEQGSYTLATGSGPECYTFSACTDDTISTIYTSGTNPGENYYEIRNGSDAVIWEESTTGSAVPGDICSTALKAFCPECAAPSNLTASNTTSTSVDIGWTQNGTETQWELEYGVYGFTPTATPTIAVSTNPATIGSLSPGECYQVYVRAVCGTDEYSDWSGPLDFCTSCPPSAPYLNNFDIVLTGEVANCWTVDATNTTSTWGQWRFTSISWDWFAGIEANTTAQDEWLNTPSFDLSTRADNIVSFDWLVIDYDAFVTNDLADVFFLVTEDGGITYDTLWTEDSVGVFDTYQWYYEEFDISGYSSSNVQFSFRYVGQNASYFFMDHFHLGTAPASTEWTGSVNTKYYQTGNWSNGVAFYPTIISIPDVSASTNRYPSLYHAAGGSQLQLSSSSELSIMVRGLLQLKSGSRNIYSNKSQTTSSGKFSTLQKYDPGMSQTHTKPYQKKGSSEGYTHELIRANPNRLKKNLPR
jgi:hypothetical protein